MDIAKTELNLYVVSIAKGYKNTFDSIQSVAVAAESQEEAVRIAANYRDSVHGWAWRIYLESNGKFVVDDDAPFDVYRKEIAKYLIAKEIDISKHRIFHIALLHG